MLIGQNWQTEYKDYAKVFGPPAGVSLYTAQLVEGQKLQWLGDGKMFVHDLNETYGNNRGMLVELTLAWKYAASCTDIRAMSVAIASGRYDSQLEEMADFFRSMPGVTFLLRVEYEVSYSLFTCSQSTENCKDQTYQNAFKYVVNHIRTKKQALNVKYVYHVMYGDQDAPCLYPGDDFVDVIGVSFFEGKYDTCYKKGVTCINPNTQATLEWAKKNHPGKPLMFPESTPQDVNKDAAWIVQFLQHVEKAVQDYNVAYWTYINMDWNKHGWAAPGWGDSRVQITSATKDHWLHNIMGAGSRYTCLDGKHCTATSALLV